MKILHLIDIPWWSGLSAYAFDCVTAHLSSGHQVWVACQKNSLSFKKALEMRISAIPIAGRKSWNALYNFGAIGIEIFKKKPDCIIAHTGSTHWIAWWWGTQLKIPVIRTRAISQPVQKSPFNKTIYSQTNWIVTASEKLKNECLDRLSSGLNEKIYIIYPPVQSVSSLSSNPHSSSLKNKDRNGGGTKIGILARLDAAKGYSDFLKSAQIVQKRYKDTEFHIAGSEENLQWHTLLKESKTLGLKNIVYHGFLPSEKVEDFMKGCGIGVIASLGSEEVSRALLEWMSVGRPVIATAVGCIPEILKDGEEGGGFLIAPCHPEQMAQKILNLLERPTAAAKMGINNLELCQKRFSKKYFQSEWDKILKAF